MPKLRCFMNDIVDSLVWGFIASSPLLIGCVIALYVNLFRRVITTIMAFGSGVLIATLTFSIVVEAFQVTHTLPATVTGFILGGISFCIANYFLKKKSAAKASSYNLKKGSSYQEKGNTTSSDSGGFLIHRCSNGWYTRKCSTWTYTCNWRRLKYCFSCCNICFKPS